MINDVLDRVDGVNAAEVTKKVKAHANDPTADLPAPPAVPKEDLNSKLKRLINTRKCMLFMKGNPDEPKCGFSKQTVAIMKDLNAEYGTFDMFHFPVDHVARRPSDSYFIEKNESNTKESMLLRPHTTIMWYHYLVK